MHSSQTRLTLHQVILLLRQINKPETNLLLTYAAKTLMKDVDYKAARHLKKLEIDFEIPYEIRKDMLAVLKYFTHVKIPAIDMMLKKRSMYIDQAKDACEMFALLLSKLGIEPIPNQEYVMFIEQHKERPE